MSTKEQRKATKAITPDTLNDFAEFGSAFRVHPDGTVSNEYPSPYFELHWFEGDESPDLVGEWFCVDGFSGQHNYAGPIMHASEFLGGAMASYVLETPGLYVLAVCEVIDGDGHILEEAAGWALLTIPDA